MKSMSFVDPNQFVITRRRKKYKFALFNNSPLCFEYDEWTPRPIDVLEVGAGTGLFSVELAARHPEQRFLAVDVKADRLQKGARAAERRGLTNIWFVRARADQLGELCEAGSLSQLWVTFPDPFPRQRSSGRRLTHPHFLTQYAKLLDEGGELLLKHDDHDFFCWSLEQLVVAGWQLRELTFDLHESERLDEESDARIMTTYEQRWVGEGKAIGFVRAVDHRINESQSEPSSPQALVGCC
jgi:tRNA (guanine-N(7)-)-methyltransferase